MGKMWSQIGYGLLIVLIIVSVIWSFFEEPFNLNYPRAFLTTESGEVELTSATVEWGPPENPSVYQNKSVVEVMGFARNGTEAIEVKPGEELVVHFDYRDDNIAPYYDVKVEVDMHTDGWLFSEDDLIEQPFYEYTLDTTFTVHAPEEPGEYGLEVEFKATLEEYVAQYIVMLHVK